jgi:hypothetical protein
MHELKIEKSWLLKQIKQRKKRSILDAQNVMMVWRRESVKLIYLGGGREGRPKRRLVQDITDDL